MSKKIQKKSLSKSQLIKNTKKKIIDDSDDSDDEENDSENESNYDSSDESESDSDSDIASDSDDDLDNDSDNKSIKYNDDDIRNIIIEKINDKFAYGKLGNFKVVIMTSNGNINATKLCQDGGKELKHWMENKSSKKMITDFCGYAGLPINEMVIKVNGGKLTKVSGTYVHSSIITHIASWCNSDYAYLVASIVNKYHSKQILEENEKLLKKKDDKIDRMSKKIDTLVENNSTLIEKNKKINNRLKRLVKQNDEIYDQNLETHGKLDAISNERVPHSGNPKKEHMLVIIKNNDDDEEYAKDEDIRKFHALRLMKQSYLSQISKHEIRHPNMEILLVIKYSPNAIHLWNVIKKKLASGRNKKIDLSGCKFNLVKGYTKKQLKKDIIAIHNERLDHDDA